MLETKSPGDLIRASDYNALADACRPYLASSGNAELMRDGNTLLDVSSPFEISPLLNSDPNPVEMPWTWTKALDDDGNVLSGEWTNCILQVGMKMYTDGDIDGREQKEDGQYYCQYDVATTSAEVKRVDLDGDVPDSQLSSGHVNFYVGKIKDGVQTGRIFQLPVVYLWL